jgi:urease accessory protein
MIRAIRHAPAGAWPEAAAAGSVTLPYDERHRRRIRLATDDGMPFLLDLARAVAMDEGDGLGLADGRWLRVRAAPESLVEVRAGSPAALARMAWHLGNRHLPVQIGGDCLRIRRDHVIIAMLQGLGAEVTAVTAPFAPERGAYAGGQGHHHHAHDDGHDQ